MRLREEATVSKLLDEFLARTKLLDSDRERLKKARGFSDKLIDEAMFRSACPENENVILGLLAEFGQHNLAEAGLIVVKNGKPEATRKFLESNIIIPYLDDGTCIGVRPHKNFVKGGVLRPYFANEEYDPDAATIMTEGEFKARAATVYGYQAFAIPGISSFLGDKGAGKKFMEFYEDLALRGIRQIIIVFDNDQKSDPNIPERYKEEAKDRWDTQYYAYLMAQKINEYGADLEASVAWIPDKYRDKTGKADIDGLLAIGLPESEFEEIIDGHLDEKDFLDSLPEEAKDVIQGKLAKREERVKFVIRDGCYFIVSIDEKSGDKSEIQVSNFTMKYLSTQIRDEQEDYCYEMEVTNNEKFVNIVKFEGNDFSDKKKFRKTLMSHGKFVWQGNDKRLDELFTEIVPISMKIIQVRSTVGWDEDLEVFFFDNCALDKGAGVVMPDANGCIAIGNKFYKIEKAEGLPEVVFTGTGPNSWNIEAIQEIALRLRDNFNSDSMYDVVSWFIAAAYKPWIFPINRTFPLLGVFGRKNSGKTRLMQWLLSIFYERPEAISFDSSTKPGLRNQATALQYLPVWLDEFRNDQKGKTYLDMLRGVYDHNRVLLSGSVIGTSRAFKLRSSLILSGEHIPADETGALNQRLITVQLKDRPAGGEFGWFETRYQTFGGIFSFLISKREEYIPKIRAEYHKLLEVYRKKPNVEQRVAINYALIHAISKKILGVKIDTLEASMEEVFHDIHKDDQDTDVVLGMLTTCLRYYKAKGTVTQIEGAIDVRKETSGTAQLVIYFNLGVCVEFYNEIIRRQGKIAVHIGQLRRDFKTHPWIDAESYIVKINKKPSRCNLARLQNAPQQLILAAYGHADEETRKHLLVVFGGEDGPLSSHGDNLFEDIVDLP